MKVKELRKYPLLWAKLYSYCEVKYEDVEERDITNSINFSETEEGQDFWWHIQYDRLDKANALFPKLFETDVFTKGMYIVYLGEPSSSKSFDTNHVYKQRVNVNYICPEIDGCGSISNGWRNRTPLSINWRPATKKEIEHYDKIGKPYNVTEMNKPSLTLEVGKWYEVNYNITGNILIEVSDLSFNFIKWNISIKVSDKLVLHDYQLNHWGNYIKDLPIIREVSLSEVQPYLPVNHPDYIKVDVKEEWVPQVGDWVIPIDEKDTDYLHPLFFKGFRIVVFNSTDTYAIPEAGKSNGIHISKIRKLEQHEIPQSNSTLPEKWVVKITKENSDVLDKWRRQQPDYTRDEWMIGAWLTSDCWNDYTYCSFANGVPTNYTEISYEEFRKHVLNDRPVRVVEEKPMKKIDMKMIQEEAKKRFPIGCEFISVARVKNKLKWDYTVYKIVDDKIYAHEGGGCLYNDGKWAELVKTPTSLSYGHFAETADQVIEIKKPTIFEDSIVNIKVKEPVKTTVEIKDTEVKIKVNYKSQIKIS